MKILILCTGNSCRSQMAEGFLKSLRKDFEIFSAGTQPEEKISPYAVKVMQEKGIDIRGQYPKNVNNFIHLDFDYLITVCDYAKEVCPVFSGETKHKLHIGFDDPYTVKGREEVILNEYRRVRDEIIIKFKDLSFEKITK